MKTVKIIPKLNVMRTFTPFHSCQKLLLLHFDSLLQLYTLSKLKGFMTILNSSRNFKNVTGTTKKGVPRDTFPCIKRDVV